MTSTLTAATILRVDALYRAAATLQERSCSYFHIGGERRHRRARFAIKGSLRLERRAKRLLEDSLCPAEKWKMIDILCAENAKAKTHGLAARATAAA